MCTSIKHAVDAVMSSVRINSRESPGALPSPHLHLCYHVLNHTTAALLMSFLEVCVKCRLLTENIDCILHA